jgi:hypothetical protein
MLMTYLGSIGDTASRRTQLIQQRHGRLQMIREKLARVKLVMDSVDGNPSLTSNKLRDNRGNILNE